MRLMLGLGLAGAAVMALILLPVGDRALVDNVYQQVFGPPLLGPVDFATLTRRASPNDALACPPEVCAAARADLTPPNYAVPAQRLRAIVAQVAAEEPGIVASGSDARPDGAHQDRYGVRSRLMRFPDTVDAQVLPRGEQHSTLALYARSQIGYSDFGVNRARLERWLRRIREIVAAGG